MPEHRQEIAIAVVEHNGHFLVGRRPPDVPLPNLFEFPGGKVEPGETPEQAVKRECEEEAGMRIDVIERYVVRDWDYDHGPLKLHFFSCHPIEPLSEPAGSFRWVARDELRELQFPEANRPLIEQLTSSCSHGR